MKVRLARLAWISLAFVLVLSCGDDGESGSSGLPEPTVDVTGTWSGTWTSGNGVDGGFASLSVTQSGAGVSGMVVFDGSPCFEVASVSGTVSANDVNGRMTSGGIRVDVELTVIGNQASGTYNVVSGGACTGDSGTIGLEALPEPTVDVTGNWSGIWLSQEVAAEGSASLTVTQSGLTVSGTASFTGSPCFSSGSFQGTVFESNVTGDLTAPGIQVAIVMGVSGNTAFGFFIVGSAGDCTGDSGFISLELDVPWDDQIAFQSDRGGNWQIAVMDADGSNQTNLSQNSWNDVFPSWSPDGSLIAFESTRDGNGEIYRMDADGRNQTRLTNNSSSDVFPSWSPNGSRIAFSTNRDGDYEIYVMDADGSNQMNLTQSSSDDFDPSWSPDGNQIVFASNRDGNYEIYRMDADGRNQTRLTFNSSNDLAPSWSPVGSRIAFATDREGDYEIYVMDTDGSNQTNLTNNFSDDFFPAWSPNGSRIAFTTDREIDNEIYVMDADGSNQTNLTNAVLEDLAPAWKPWD